MYVEMACNCESSFTIESDGENNESLWTLAWRFANAHVGCGFVTFGDAPEGEREIYDSNNISQKKRSVEEEELSEDDE